MIDVEISLVAAFLIGITSSIHCLGMCGGIITVLSLSLSKENTKDIFIYQIYYNIGRFLGYIFINIIIFFFGLIIVKSFGVENSDFLKLIFSFTLIVTGINILFSLNLLKFIEILGWKFWPFFYSKIKKKFPVKSIFQAICLGFIWAQIPCGLVYSISIFAASTGSIIKSLLVMISFSLGTLPIMLYLGTFSIKLKYALKNSFFKSLISVLIIYFGIFTSYNYFFSSNCH